jgi:hypothetical protein
MNRVVRPVTSLYYLHPDTQAPTFTVGTQQESQMTLLGGGVILATKARGRPTYLDWTARLGALGIMSLEDPGR